MYTKAFAKACVSREAFSKKAEGRASTLTQACEIRRVCTFSFGEVLV